MHSAGDLVMWRGNSNGHAGRHIEGHNWVHGGIGVGQRNLKGRMLLEFYLEKELYVPNAWLKREEKIKVIFRMEEDEIEIDIVLIKKKQTVYRKCEMWGVSACISVIRYRY